MEKYQRSAPKKLAQSFQITRIFHVDIAPKKLLFFFFCALFLEANTCLLHSLRAKYSVLGAWPVLYISTMICIRKR